MVFQRKLPIRRQRNRRERERERARRQRPAELDLVQFVYANRGDQCSCCDTRSRRWPLVVSHRSTTPGIPSSYVALSRNWGYNRRLTPHNSTCSCVTPKVCRSADRGMISKFTTTTTSVTCSKGTQYEQPEQKSVAVQMNGSNSTSNHNGPMQGESSVATPICHPPCSSIEHRDQSVQVLVPSNANLLIETQLNNNRLASSTIPSRPNNEASQIQSNVTQNVNNVGNNVNHTSPRGRQLNENRGQLNNRSFSSSSIQEPDIGLRFTQRLLSTLTNLRPRPIEVDIISINGEINGEPVEISTDADENTEDEEAGGDGHHNNFNNSIELQITLTASIDGNNMPDDDVDDADDEEEYDNRNP